MESRYSVVQFVEVNNDKKEGVFTRYPDRKEIHPDINEQLIVEFYNR